MIDKERRYLGGELTGITDEGNYWEITIKDADGIQHPIRVAKSTRRPMRADDNENG